MISVVPFLLFASYDAAMRMPTEAAVNAISDAKEYTMRISAPGVEKTVTFRKGMTAAANDSTWSGWRIVPYLLPLTTRADGTGEVKLSFEFPGRKDAIVLHSRGLAEDVYLLRTLGGEADAAKWLDKKVPTSKLVSQWPADAPAEVGERLKKVPEELAAAVKLGQDAYEANRPELIRRFARSLLYYPPMTEKRWDVSTGKNTLWLDTGCHDRMFAARFRVELRKTDKGLWEVASIYATEFFKGE
jgi:hypothetical protein